MTIILRQFQRDKKMGGRKYQKRRTIWVVILTSVMSTLIFMNPTAWEEKSAEDADDGTGECDRRAF